MDGRVTEKVEDEFAFSSSCFLLSAHMVDLMHAGMDGVEWMQVKRAQYEWTDGCGVVPNAGMDFYAGQYRRSHMWAGAVHT